MLIQLNLVPLTQPRKRKILFENWQKPSKNKQKPNKNQQKLQKLTKTNENLEKGKKNAQEALGKSGQEVNFAIFGRRFPNPDLRVWFWVGF